MPQAGSCRRSQIDEEPEPGSHGAAIIRSAAWRLQHPRSFARPWSEAATSGLSGARQTAGSWPRASPREHERLCRLLHSRRGQSTLVSPPPNLRGLRQGQRVTQHKYRGCADQGCQKQRLQDPVHHHRSSRPLCGLPLAQDDRPVRAVSKSVDASGFSRSGKDGAAQPHPCNDTSDCPAWTISSGRPPPHREFYVTPLVN